MGSLGRSGVPVGAGLIFAVRESRGSSHFRQPTGRRRPGAGGHHSRHLLIDRRDSRRRAGRGAQSVPVKHVPHRAADRWQGHHAHGGHGEAGGHYQRCHERTQTAGREADRPAAPRPARHLALADDARSDDRPVRRPAGAHALGIALQRACYGLVFGMHFGQPMPAGGAGSRVGRQLGIGRLVQRTQCHRQGRRFIYVVVHASPRALWARLVAIAYAARHRRRLLWPGRCAGARSGFGRSRQN